MQESKGLKPKQPYRKEYKKIREKLLKIDVSLRNVCKSEDLNRGNVHRAFLTDWNTEAAQKTRQQLKEAVGKQKISTTTRGSKT